MKDPARRDSPDEGPKRLGRFLWIAGLAVVYGLPLVTLRGAVDIFLKIDTIPGESKDKTHTDEIDVLAWSWGMSQSGSFHVGGGGGAGKVNFQDLSVTKFIDKSSALLARACATGEHYDKATLTVRTADGKMPLEYLVINMKKVLVTSYQTGGSSGEPPQDSISLSYSDYEERVFTFDPDGNVTGEFEVFWNVPTNTGGGNDLVENSVPTITAIPDQTTSEDGPAVTVTFTIDDADTPAGALILGRSSGNQDLIPNANIVFGGSGANRSATITPADDEFGTSSLIISVSDGSMSASTNFTVEVTPVNDPPSVGLVASQVTDQDIPLDVAVTLSDIDDDPAGLILTATSSNPALLPEANITIPSAGNPRVLTFTPAQGQFGETVITLTAQDDGGLPSPPVEFLLTVNGLGTGIDAITLNGLPSSEPISLPENSPNGTAVGFVETTPFDPGLIFSLADDAGGRFGFDPTDPSKIVVANGSLLDFESAPLHTVIVQATNPAAGSTRSEVFTVQLTNVNDPPLVTVPADFGTAPQNTLWNLGGIAINDPDSDPNPILVTFSVTSGELHVDNGLLPGATITGDGTGTVVITASAANLNTMLSTFAGLTYRSTPTFTGTETVTITTDDLGNTGPGGPLTGAASATLEVVLTPWELWRQLNFLGSELADLSISGFSADFDNDGLPNGGEYAVDGDPKDPLDGPGKIQLIYIDSGGLSFPALLFPRRVSDPDLSITAEVATDILNWSSGPAFTFEAGATPIDPDFDQPTVRSLWDVTEGSKQQMRLHFSLDTP